MTSSLGSLTTLSSDDGTAESSANHDDEVEKQTFRIRLQAANLSYDSGGVFGMKKKRPPDTFAVVTSAANPSSATATAATAATSPSRSYDSLPEVPRPQRIDQRSKTDSSSSSNNVIWGQTEVITRNSNPQWTKTITLDNYKLGTPLFFYVHLFQHSSDKRHLSSFGTALFHVTDLLATKHYTRCKRLRHGGCLYCRLEPIYETTGLHTMVHLKFRIIDLIWPRKLFLRMTTSMGQRQSRKQMKHLVLEISKRATNTSGWLTVHRSAPLLQAQDDEDDNDDEDISTTSSSKQQEQENVISWEMMQIDLETLCGSNYDRPLRLALYLRFPRAGGKKCIALSETTLRHLLPSQQPSNDDDDDDEASSSIAANSDDDIDDNPTQQQIDGGKNNNKRGVVIELFLQRHANKTKQVGRLQVCKAFLQSTKSSSTTPIIRPRRPSSSSLDTTANTSVIEVVDLSQLAAMPPPSKSSSTKQTAGYNNHTKVNIAERFRWYTEQKMCQIDFCVAIDFTSSNGDPNREDSLHYLGGRREQQQYHDNVGIGSESNDSNPLSLNDYEETITAIGTALERYSETQEYSVWGFGAKYSNVVRHIFQCGATPTVHGVDGILAAYQSVFENDLVMSGPTNFSQVLKAAASRAKRYHDAMTTGGNLQQQQQQLRYMVLLVITDGIMNNFDETKKQLDVYSFLPLSVIFVGLGRQTDFSTMYRLCRCGSPGDRDIAKFVEFRKYQHNDPAALGEAALASIPTQLCEYMQRQGI